MPMPENRFFYKKKVLLAYLVDKRNCGMISGLHGGVLGTGMNRWPLLDEYKIAGWMHAGTYRKVVLPWLVDFAYQKNLWMRISVFRKVTFQKTQSACEPQQIPKRSYAAYADYFSKRIASALQIPEKIPESEISDELRIVERKYQHAAPNDAYWRVMVQIKPDAYPPAKAAKMGGSVWFESRKGKKNTPYAKNERTTGKRRPEGSGRAAGRDAQRHRKDTL